METNYFYQFMEPISKELAYVARELENSIFTSPRTMLTHARMFIENILHQIMVLENIPYERNTSLNSQIRLLQEHDLINEDMFESLQFIRKLGNQAAHDSRVFRYSEALLSWEALYHIVKWYVEVYGPHDIQVPAYQDPKPQHSLTYDIAEVQQRLHSLEKQINSGGEVQQGNELTTIEPTEQPGHTTIRTLIYRDQELEIPYFLRDAFLLPQRFKRSETFLIRLGSVQEARIMSELPRNIEGLHNQVKRFNEKNDELFFMELGQFIEEEKIRRQITLERPGELFLFFQTKFVIVTEELANTPITSENFSGIPSLIRQLKEDQIETIGQLPSELVILAKYENVGIGTVEKLFEQMKNMQNKKS